MVFVLVALCCFACFWVVFVVWVWCKVGIYESWYFGFGLEGSLLEFWFWCFELN